MVSAAEKEGAQARMWTFSSDLTSWRIDSITVFVLPVPGGPEIKKGRSPWELLTIASTAFYLLTRRWWRSPVVHSLVLCRPILSRRLLFRVLVLVSISRDLVR